MRAERVAPEDTARRIDVLGVKKLTAMRGFCRRNAAVRLIPGKVWGPLVAARSAVFTGSTDVFDLLVCKRGQVILVDVRALSAVSAPRLCNVDRQARMSCIAQFLALQTIYAHVGCTLLVTVVRVLAAPHVANILDHPCDGHP